MLNVLIKGQETVKYSELGLYQTACCIFLQPREELQLLKSITAWKLTCLSAVCVHVLAPYD